jgi:hypothetical protein
MMTMAEVELSEILDALRLGHQRAIELMASTGCEIFGLSFGDDGNVKWQFIVSKVFGDQAIVKTYSWVDGSYYSTETLSLPYIKERCALYTNEDNWRDDAMMLGAKAINMGRTK